MAIEFFTQRTMENSDRFFKQRTNARPMIYAYEDASYPGCLKVGYTAVDVENA